MCRQEGATRGLSAGRPADLASPGPGSPLSRCEGGSPAGFCGPHPVPWPARPPRPASETPHASWLRFSASVATSRSAVPGLYVYRLSLSLECSWVQKRKKRWRLDEARPQMLDLPRTQRLSPCFADRGGASARVGPEHCRRLGKGRPASHATTLVRDAR